MGCRGPQRSESRCFLNNLRLCQNDRWRHVSLASILPDGSAATPVSGLASPGPMPGNSVREEDGAKTTSHVVQYYKPISLNLAQNILKNHPLLDTLIEMNVSVDTMDAGGG